MRPSESEQPATKHGDKKSMPESVKVGKALAEAFDSVGNTSQLGGLEKSKWAPTSNASSSDADAGEMHGKQKLDSSSTADEASGNNTPTKHSVDASAAGGQSTATIANVDDVSAFMAAVRLRSGNESVGKSAKKIKEADHFIVRRRRVDIELKKDKSKTRIVTKSILAKTMCLPVDEDISIMMPDIEEREASPATTETSEETRFHQMYFENWGSPAPRDAPGAEIRRVTLTNIPTWLASPDRVLALVHGGRVEKLFMPADTTTAQVLFTKEVDCRQFYEKYRNGIFVNYNGRSAVVHVALSTIPDVMSSRIHNAISEGATRVIRAIGADMELNMVSLAALSEERHCVAEKIVDTFTTMNEVRTVTFRFLSIDDALRFKAHLNRLAEWESANVQWGIDPCEVAAGIHWD